MPRYQYVALMWLVSCLTLCRQVNGSIALAWEEYENYMNRTLSFNVDASNAYVGDIKLAKVLPNEPILPDFSWAGYEYSNKPIPRIEGPIFNVVTEFGAKNDGSEYVDAKVTHAIRSAARHGGGVVYFPAGIYMFSPPGSNSSEDVLQITASNIVLRGAGAHEGGTLLYMDQPRVNRSLIKITGRIGHKPITTVVGSVATNSMVLKVANPKSLRSKKYPCFMVNYQNPSYNKYIFGNATLQSTWEWTNQKGAYVHEPHCIQHVDLKTGVVTMTEPMKQPLFEHENEFPVLGYNPIYNIGIENIRFQSGWSKADHSFCHHCSMEDDKGWTAIKTYAARNLWIRDCEFADWSAAAMLERTSSSTVRDCNVTGRGGHLSFQSKRGYGNLFMDNRDLAGARHGPSVEASDVGSVYLRHIMQPGQSIDMHADNPRYTLLDSCVGGMLGQNGGKLPLYPHHSGKLVLWNFQFNDLVEPEGYSFWTNETTEIRSKNNYFQPIIVGLRGNSGDIDKDSCLHM
eukprot:Ihof_evm1s912 gene=Ihof_evmTU1s912